MPSVLDTTLIDEVIKVTNEESIDLARRLPGRTVDLGDVVAGALDLGGQRPRTGVGFAASGTSAMLSGMTRRNSETPGYTPKA